MKNVLLTLTALFALFANPLNAQIIQGSLQGTELACLSSTDTYTFWWSDADTDTTAIITYSIKTRDSGSIDVSDVVKSESNGILTLIIDKNHFDIIVTMTVKIGTATKKFTQRVQVGLGDALNIDMITISPTTIRCRDNTTQITLSVDKMNVYGVDFLWIFPIGWVQTVGDANSNYIKVRPDGIHTGSITCQMKVYGDQFCEGNEVENYLGPIVSIDYPDLLPPTINRGQPSGTSKSLTHNSAEPIRFVVSSKSGATYTWSLPCGWQGPNGQTNSFTSTTSYVDITPSGYTGPGEQVKVVANMDCAGTPKNSNYVTWSFVWDGGQNSTILGSPFVCSTNRTYSISNPVGTTVTWSVSPANLFAVDNGTGNSFTTRATNSFVRGDGTITATVSGSCGSSTTPKSVWVGKPAQPVTSPSYPTIQMSLGQIKLIRVTSALGIDNPYQYSWRVTGSINQVGGNGSNTHIEATRGGRGNFLVKTRNQCGYSTNGGGSVSVNTGGGGGGGPAHPLSVAPNPAASFIDIELPFKVEKDKGEKGEVTIFNNQNRIVYSKQMAGKRLQVNTRNLPNGLYYLRVKYGEQIYSRQIVVKH